MTIEQPFSLTPFPAPDLPQIAITGLAARHAGLLTLHYSLTGNIEDIFLPPLSLYPCRKDELWKTTCFECFLAIEDQPQYWEFNISPSGDWNIYHMDAYPRIAFREETSIHWLPFHFQMDDQGCFLKVAVNLLPIIREGQRIKIGITAVIQSADGDITYWALAHPAPRADFHLKESFICSL